MNTIPCSCGRAERHAPACNVAIAFQRRCPECNTRKVNGQILHNYRCPLRRYEWP